MFHAWLVKIAKIDAASTPRMEPGNNTIQMVTVADRKPRIGTDCEQRYQHHAQSPASGRRQTIDEAEHQ